MSPLPPQIFSMEKMTLFILHKKGAMHGYGLAQFIEEKFQWCPSQTAIYKALKSLTSKKFVQFEEKIENGRVQKIYSLTDLGRKKFVANKRALKKQMMNNLAYIQHFIHNVETIESMKESEEKQDFAAQLLTDMNEINNLSLPLLHADPQALHEVVKTALNSMRKIAKKHKVENLMTVHHTNCEKEDKISSISIPVEDGDTSEK